MTRSLFVSLLMALASLLPAAEVPIAAETQQAWNRTKNNVMRAAEKMPEEHYGYKPAPESQSFGDLVAHTANAAMGVCSGLGGERRRAGVDGSASKADLVAALGKAFAECEKVYGGLTADNASDMIAGRRGERTRLSTLWGNTVHIEHEYAQMAVHMRLNGITPPSSEGRGGMGRGARGKKGGR